MSKTTKIWLIAAASLILLGCILLGGAMAVLKWDFFKLATDQYQTNDHKITESFRSIRIDTDTADIKIVASENKKCSVTCFEQKNMTHSVAVENGTLVIQMIDARKWYEHIGIHFSSPKITVYLPEGEYDALSVSSDTSEVEIAKDFSFQSIHIEGHTGAVTNYASASETIRIHTTTGRIHVDNVSAGAMDLSVSTGKVIASNISCAGRFSLDVTTGKAQLDNITCQSLSSEGSTGDIHLKQVIATKTISVERSTGDVIFDGSDAAEIFVETDTGDVEGTLLTDKVFITETDTGRVRVPSSATGGRCEISTDTGNITIKIRP